MEQHLGRKLKSNEHVDHINGLKFDNRIENLRIMSISEHTKHHNPNIEQIELICNYCNKKFKLLPSQVRYRKKKRDNIYCSSECVGYSVMRVNHELIISEYNKGLSGYMIAKKHKFNKQTVYNTILKHTGSIT